MDVTPREMSHPNWHVVIDFCTLWFTFVNVFQLCSLFLPQYSFIVPIGQYHFGQLYSLVIKGVENFFLMTWDRIRPRICKTGAECKAICIIQGINKDCPPTCWFVSLGFTNRVSKDHRGNVGNSTMSPPTDLSPPCPAVHDDGSSELPCLFNFLLWKKPPETWSLKCPRFFFLFRSRQMNAHWLCEKLNTRQILTTMNNERLLP